MRAIVAFRLPDGGQKAIANFARQRIERGIIDRYDANAVPVLIIYGICGHEYSPAAAICFLGSASMNIQFAEGNRQRSALDKYSVRGAAFKVAPCSERL